MLKQVAILLTLVIVFVGCFLLIERQASPFFQSCISQGSGDESNQSSKEGDTGIGSVILVYMRCSGKFLDGHGGGITALFTIVLAASTILLWQVTNKAAEAAKAAAEHIPRVERAYMFWGPGKISIGENPKEGKFTVIEMNVTHFGETPGFFKMIGYKFSLDEPTGVPTYSECHFYEGSGNCSEARKDRHHGASQIQQYRVPLFLWFHGVPRHLRYHPYKPSVY